MAGAVTAFLGLGSNLGDREGSIRAACRLLLEDPGIPALRLSRLRETEPVGAPGAPAGGGPYLNAVAEVITTLSPLELLDRCLGVEAELGRTRSARNAPRPIDIDLLLYGNQTVRIEVPEPGPGLTVPHPRMLERAFVLEPLAEIAPGAIHPLARRTARELWRALRNRDPAAAGRPWGPEVE